MRDDVRHQLAGAINMATILIRAVCWKEAAALEIPHYKNLDDSANRLIGDSADAVLHVRFRD